MERRELLKMIAVLTGGAFVGGELILSGCKNNQSTSGSLFTSDDIAFLNTVADTLLPKTSSPGAGEANVGTFMARMVDDCYEPADQKIFYAGIQSINEAAQKKYSKPFLKLAEAERTSLLNELDHATREAVKKGNEAFAGLKPEDWEKITLERNYSGKDPVKEKLRQVPGYYFVQMKQLALLGFFTSKEGATKALRYIAVPGKYDGALPYKKGDKAWAT